MKKADSKADFGARPYQTIIDLFEFRDDLAHPKAETIAKTRNIGGSTASRIGYVLSQNEKFYQDEKNIERVRGDVDTVVKATWQKDWGFHPYDSGSQWSVIKE